MNDAEADLTATQPQSDAVRVTGMAVREENVAGG